MNELDPFSLNVRQRPLLEPSCISSTPRTAGGRHNRTQIITESQCVKNTHNRLTSLHEMRKSKRNFHLTIILLQITWNRITLKYVITQKSDIGHCKCTTVEDKWLCVSCVVRYKCQQCFRKILNILSLYVNVRNEGISSILKGVYIVFYVVLQGALTKCALALGSVFLQ